MTDELEIHELKDRQSLYDDVRAPRSDKHGGYIALNGAVVAQTLQCCHCQKHWVVRPNSGTIRGFCRMCMQVTCGKVECDPCIPFEKKLDMIEAAERQRREVDKWLTG